MTPKEKYNERKRLKADRLLREEKRVKDNRSRDDDVKAQMISLVSSFERIADALELWADQQK